MLADASGGSVTEPISFIRKRRVMSLPRWMTRVRPPFPAPTTPLDSVAWKSPAIQLIPPEVDCSCFVLGPAHSRAEIAFLRCAQGHGYQGLMHRTE